MKVKYFFGGILVVTLLAVPIFFHPAKAATTPIDFAGFTGVGLAPTPTAGQLDSNLWRVTGLSDGDGSFGGTHTSGDFARGSHDGGTGTGGIYAFDIGGGDTILGVQPTASDFAPGTFTLRISNDTGAMISDLYIAYEIWTFNDQNRSNALNFSWSLDDSGYTDVPTLDYSTPETADPTPSWQMTFRSATLMSVNLADGASIYLQWYGDDVSGSGARDEYGIDDIEVRIDGPTANSFVSLKGRSASGKSFVFALVSLCLVCSLIILDRLKTK